jgi:hypothetical protein
MFRFNDDTRLVCKIASLGGLPPSATQEYVDACERGVARKLMRRDQKGRFQWTIKGNILRNELLAGVARLEDHAVHCEWDRHPLKEAGFPAMVEVAFAGQKVVCQAVAMLGERRSGVTSMADGFAGRAVLCLLRDGDELEMFAVELHRVRVLGKDEV